MEGTHKLKIKGKSPSPKDIKVFLDGEELTGVQSVKLYIDVDYTTKADILLIVEPDVEIKGLNTIEKIKTIELVGD